ncbi:hypothetical protein D3C76_1234710 [compost metagenome]
MVDLLGAFPQQEQATEEQDQVAPGDAMAEDLEQVGSQAHDPGDRQQQEDARDHGQGQAEDPGTWLHVLGHAADQDRDHDDVVDPEHDLKRGEGEKGNPDFRAGQPFHVYSFER